MMTKCALNVATYFGRKMFRWDVRPTMFLETLKHLYAIPYVHSVMVSSGLNAILRYLEVAQSVIWNE